VDHQPRAPRRAPAIVGRPARAHLPLALRPRNGAAIALQQPVTAAEIQAVRGIRHSDTIRTLLKRTLIAPPAAPPPLRPPAPLPDNGKKLRGNLDSGVWRNCAPSGPQHLSDPQARIILTSFKAQHIKTFMVLQAPDVDDLALSGSTLGSETGAIDLPTACHKF
jgi:hypothetical protein